MILLVKNEAQICHTEGLGALNYLDMRDMGFVAFVEACKSLTKSQSNFTCLDLFYKTIGKVKRGFCSKFSGQIISWNNSQKFAEIC